MKKLLLAGAVVMLSMMVFAPLAQAISPSEQECLDAGGTFSRIQGTVTCTIVEDPVPVGNAPEHSNAQRTQNTDEESGQGNTTNQNSPHYEDPPPECTGPPGQCKQRV